MSSNLNAARHEPHRHDIVQEGCAAAPDAGDKTWTTGG